MLKWLEISWPSAIILAALTVAPTSAFALTNDPAYPLDENVAGEKVQRIPLQSMSPAMSPDQDGEGSEPVSILRDTTLLPEPVQRLRRLIIEAARSGDIERLRPLLGTSSSTTRLSFGEAPEDPIAFLREISGDEKGYEILAILLEVMESPFVELPLKTDEAIYVWPYFVEMSLDELSPEQLVELMTLATAGDYAAMQEFGAYNFFRVGITPEGEWIFFVAGD